MNSFMFEMPFETFVTVRSPSGCSMKINTVKRNNSVLNASFCQKVPGRTITALHTFFIPEIVTCFWKITWYSPRKTHLVKFTWTVLNIKAELSSGGHMCFCLHSCKHCGARTTLSLVTTSQPVMSCSKMCFGKTSIHP